MSLSYFGNSSQDGLGANVVRVTPKRKTRLRLDVPEYVLTEPSFAIYREAGEMARTNPNEQAVDVLLVDGHGWELRPKQFTTGYQHERTEAAGTLVPLNTPSGWSLLAQYRKPDDLPNATSGASAGLASTADQFLTKRVAAGDNWDAADYRLSADQTAMPSPDGDDTIKMDRIAVGTSNHDENSAFFWRIICQGARVTSPDNLASTYFNGPAGVSAAFLGSGYFWLCLKGDGELWLKERALDRALDEVRWVVRAVFRYCDPQKACNASHRLYIKPVTYKKPRGSISGSIHIFADTQERSNSSSMFFVGYKRSPLQQVALYRSFTNEKTRPAINNQPQRIDVRRDARHKVQLARTLYPSSGSLRCDAFGALSFFTSNQKLKLYWYGKVPPGCSITPTLYDALTGGALSAAPPTTFTQDGEIIGGYREFDVEYPQRQFYPQFDFTAPEDAGVAGYSTITPTLRDYRCIRRGVVENLEPEELTSKIMDFSMTGADADPVSETGGCTIKDLLGNLDRLRTRSMIPAIVEVACPTTEDPDQVSHLMHGYVVSAGATRMGSKIASTFGGSVQQTVATDDWRAYDVRLAGAWTRLSSARVPFRWSFSTDTNGEPPKLTDVIKDAFFFSGYVEDQLDVPDLPQRLFPTDDDSQSYALEAMADISEFIQHLTMDYLGYWMTFDPNAKNPDTLVDRGLWRILPSNVPDGDGNYNILAHFHTELSNDAFQGSGKYSPVGLLGYKQETEGDQVIQHCFVRKGTVESGIRTPEANLLCVTGTGRNTFSDGIEAENALTVTIPNYRSFNFAGVTPGHPLYPDPDHPDYLPNIVPMLKVNRSLRTLDAVRYFARRVFQRVCHGAKTLKFEAPLLLIWDANDSKQIRPRPLRFYDAVKVDGVPWFVTSVSPKYRKDSAQWAYYTLELPNGALY